MLHLLRRLHAGRLQSREKLYKESDEKLTSYISLKIMSGFYERCLARFSFSSRSPPNFQVISQPPFSYMVPYAVKPSSILSLHT
jgi:hypothetical protein